MKNIVALVIFGSLTIALSAGVFADDSERQCHDRCNLTYDRCCRNRTPCPDDVIHDCVQDVRCCNLACDGHDCQRN
jgi:hypothetical protein